MWCLKMLLNTSVVMQMVWRVGSPPLKSTDLDRPENKEAKEEKEAAAEGDRIYREKASAAISRRELIPCVSHSPFATKGNYISDLGDEEEYLRPKSSHD